MTEVTPPYTAVIFTAEQSGRDTDQYEATAERMNELAAQQPGYRGIESVRDSDGYGITISYWNTPDDALAWKQNGEHLLAQRLGREGWYSKYRVRIATVEREYSYDQQHPSDEHNNANEP